MIFNDQEMCFIFYIITQDPDPVLCTLYNKAQQFDFLGRKSQNCPLVPSSNFGCWFPLAVKISLGDFSSQGKHATKNTKSVRLEVQSRFEVMKQLYSLAQASLLHDWSLRLSYLCIVLVSVQELLMHIVLFLPSSLTGLMDRLRKTSATINISLV